MHIEKAVRQAPNTPDSELLMNYVLIPGICNKIAIQLNRNMCGLTGCQIAQTLNIH